MADLDMEKLVKAAARADSPEWDNYTGVVKRGARARYRAILAAVLPLVLAGPRKALRPPASPAEIFGADWSDDDELAVEPIDDYGCGSNGRLLFTIKIGDLRRARSELSRIEALLKDESREG